MSWVYVRERGIQERKILNESERETEKERERE